MTADTIVRYLFGFLPSRKAIDHLVMRAGNNQIAEPDVDDFGNLALGDLPALRHRNARHVWENSITGGTRLLHWQLGQDILARHDQAELLARFAQRGIEHGVVFRIMLAAWKG